MPPKGRKKGATSAKSGSNGIEVKSNTNGIVEEFPSIEKSLEERVEAAKSGRGRKKAIAVENKEDLESKPVLDEEESVNELKKGLGENAPEDQEPGLKVPKKNGSTSSPAATEDDVEPAGNGEHKETESEIIEDEVVLNKAKEEPVNNSGKRGRKKAGVPETDQVTTTEVKEEPEKAIGKRGRKKAVVAEVDEETTDTQNTETKDESEAKEEPEKAMGRRGRKKAVAIEDKEEPEKATGRRGRKKAEIVETVKSTEEPEKISGKRNRKKSDDAPQGEEMEVEEETAPPAKRSQNVKSAAAKKDKVEDEEDTEDFVPRKTRGVRNPKDITKEVAPVSKGKKRKVPGEKAEGKQSKRGKGAETLERDAKVEEDSRQVTVVIERNHDIDEMARNSSFEEEKDTKAKSVKGPAKSGGRRKRANQDAGDSKPEKVQKEEPSKAKGGSKKPPIPDVSALDFSNTSKTPDGKPWNFKIASWNVNGVRAWLEKNGLSYLHHEKPDILCVQETKCSEDKLPEELEVEGYHCHWLAGDKDGYSGVGIISKQKPLSIADGIGIEEHDNEGRVITAEYEKFYLVTTYVPNSGRGLVRLDYRKNWDEDFRAYLKMLDEKKPVVLCGDLNVSHQEIDIANPKNNKKNAGFTQEERDGFSALLKEGFVDTFRHLYPDTKDAYTFWTYMMNARAKNVGWRLDYFVISERFKDHLCDSLIRKEVFGSDHCPVGLLLHI